MSEISAVEHDATIVETEFLREMLAEAVRNSQPQRGRPSAKESVRDAPSEQSNTPCAIRRDKRRTGKIKDVGSCSPASA